MGKTAKDKRDIYYRLAKEEGWRARSAYKLLQIDEKFNVFNGVKSAVDLCAAPGSWSQVLAKKLLNQEQQGQDVKIVAVDLQLMAPIQGVIQIQGDITNMETARQIIEHFNGSKADLVVCDGAPDVIGLHDLDEYIQGQLVLSALNITTNILNSNGTFITKVFRGKHLALLYSQLKMFFNQVTIAKPRTCRNSSIEAFAVCQNYSPPKHYDGTIFKDLIDEKSQEYFKNMNYFHKETEIPFLACGNGFDADCCYPLNSSLEETTYKYHEPTQSPIDPPYKKAIQLKKNDALEKPMKKQKDEETL